MIFCDTSVIAKFYVPETGSEAVRLKLESEESISISELVRVELMGVFHRRLREGRWSPADFQAAMRQFNHDDISGFWNWLPLDQTIVEAAAKTYATLPATIFLRSADCIHLVTALHHNFTEVYTFDHHQTTACPSLGLVVLAI